MALVLLASVLVGSVPSQPAVRRHVLLVVDGLRPDFVTPEVMPRLTAVGRRGVVFTRHHAVFPSVTRVNGASLATGAYPETHGLMGNSVYVPTIDPRRFLDTASRGDLARLTAGEPRLLTAPTLGERLKAAGHRMLVVSSGSAGSAILNDPTVAGGAILHPEFTMPESWDEALTVVGGRPGGTARPEARDRFAVDAFLKVGLPRIDPTVTVLWLGSLDATAHAKGIGTPEVTAVLRHLDHEIGRVEDGLAAAGLRDMYDLWIASDHGFSTHVGAADVAALLKPHAGPRADGTPRVIAGSGAVYVRDGSAATVRAIVEGLQATDGIGAIFTEASQAGAAQGRVAGTLSFDVARWRHPRSAQILYAPDWSDAANAHGVRGTVRAGGVAGHGSSSPWDIHNTLIAAGPDIAAGLRIDVPSGNVDLMPTMLTLLGLEVPSSVQGRVLREAFARPADRQSPPVVTAREHTARTPDDGYVVTAQESVVRVGAGEYRYLDGTRVSRRPRPR